MYLTWKIMSINKYTCYHGWFIHGVYKNNHKYYISLPSNHALDLLTHVVDTSIQHLSC